MSPWFPAAFRPPAFACWASCSRRGIQLPSRSAYQTSPKRHLDPDGVSTFHTSESRPGLGALFTPRPSGALTAGQTPPAVARPLCQGPGPITPVLIPSPELSMTGRHQGFTHVHPPGLPLTCGPRMERGPLGLGPRASHPRQAGPAGARQGRGRALSTCPELHDRHRRTSYP